MKIENLNQQELEQLQTLLNKMNSVVEVEINPVDKMIDEIINEFNFARVQQVMDFLDWRWMGKYVTDVMLRDEAERLLRGAAKCRLGEFKDEHWELGIINATGGFTATAYCNEDKTKITGLNLQFVLEEWNTEIREIK